MAGLAFICVGRRKTGKTTLSKKLLSARKNGIPCIVYDINNEYKEFYPEKFEDFDVFLKKIVELRGHYILIEEATIFFHNTSSSMEMKNLLVRARHTGNIIQLNFHSFSSVPREIYSLLDYVTVFKTNDSEKMLERFDSPKLLAAFNKIRESKNPFENLTVDLY
jgi:hypothetical protein